MRCWVLVSIAAGLAFGQQSPVDRAAELYQKTQYRQALALLNADRSRDAAALALAGKSFFQLGQFKEATDALNKAVNLRPASSDTWHWLGKAYGRRAETSSFITAPKYASDCRKAFERAVQLDPHNLEAMSDLMEYYIEAPGILGGGMDKAEEMARRIAAVDPAEGYWAQARLAMKRKEPAAVERHLRAAAEAAPGQIGRAIDLARFLARQGRIEESEKEFQRAERIAPDSPKLLFARAQFYVEGRRNLAEARALLQRFLGAELTPDDPSRQQAEGLLRRIGGA